jgi:hypothetical protein
MQEFFHDHAPAERGRPTTEVLQASNLPTERHRPQRRTHAQEHCEGPQRLADSRRDSAGEYLRGVAKYLDVAQRGIVQKPSHPTGIRPFRGRA